MHQLLGRFRRTSDVILQDFNLFLGFLSLRRRVVVQARAWSGGWELVLDDGQATQVSELDFAEQQVRDFLDTLEPELDHSDVDVEIIIHNGSQ